MFGVRFSTMATRGRPRNETVVTVEYLNKRFEHYYDHDAFWHFLTREVHGDDGDFAGFVPNPKFEEFKNTVSQQHTDFQQRLKVESRMRAAETPPDFQQQIAAFKADIHAERDAAWHIQANEIDKVDLACNRLAEKIDKLEHENMQLKGEIEALKSTQKSQFSVLWACLKPAP